jgi:DnaJ-class molecular chaperone
VSDSFATLGLPRTATPTEVKARWRALRTQLHPDHGGDAVKFHDAQRAYDLALKLAQVCPRCDGKGKRIHTMGFNQLVVRCPDCRGTGGRDV